MFKFWFLLVASSRFRDLRSSEAKAAGRSGQLQVALVGSYPTWEGPWRMPPESPPPRRSRSPSPSRRRGSRDRDRGRTRRY